MDKLKTQRWHDGLLAGVMTALPLAASLLVVTNLLVMTGMPFTGVYTASFVTAILGTILMGRCRLAVAAAPGLALTSWLVYIVILARGVSWQMVLFMGAAASLVSFLLLAGAPRFPRLQQLPEKLMPPCLRRALRGAVGLMLIALGLFEGRLLMGAPTGLLQLGGFSDPMAYLSFTGILVLFGLMAMKKRWAPGAAFLVTAVLAFIGGFWVLPDAPFLQPEGLDRTGLQLIFMTGWQTISPACYFDLSVFLLLFLLVSGAGSLTALAPEAAKRKPLCLLSLVSFIGCLLGTMPVMAAPESAVGQAVGSSRPQRMAYWTAAVLALLLVAEPVMASLASFAAVMVPVLVGAGVVMLRRMGPVFQGDFAEQAAAGLLFLLLPLTQDIAAGLGASVIAYVCLKLLAGCDDEVPRPMRVLAVCFALYFFFGFWSMI